MGHGPAAEESSKPVAEHKPFIAAEANIAEFTPKAVIIGVFFGLVFGASTVYLALKAGLTVSASIPAAVMTVALFRALRLRGTILEANLSQTIGSASTSLRCSRVRESPGSPSGSAPRAS